MKKLLVLPIILLAVLVFGFPRFVALSPSHPVTDEENFTLEGDPFAQCVVAKLGKDRMLQLLQENQVPTAEEEAVFKACKEKLGFTSDEVGDGAHFEKDPMYECILQKVGKAEMEKMMKEGKPTAAVKDAMIACMNREKPGLVACLKKAVGEKRFNEISGGAEPTTEEMKKGEACFVKHGEPHKQIETKSHAAVPSEVETCLKNVLGSARVEELKKSGGAGMTHEEKQKAQQCFKNEVGEAPQPMEPTKQMKMDETTAACLKNAVGEKRFIAISKGEAVPTPEEVKAGQACFGEKPKEAISNEDVLILDSAAVPYYPEDNESVGVKDVSPTADGGAVVIEGETEPNSTVDIHVYSEPVAVRTQSDANGNYSYNLETSLGSGDHVVYATTTKDGEVVRSSAKTFTLGQAIVPTVEAAEETADESAVAGVRYYMYLGALGLLGLILVSSVLFVRRRRTA